MYLFSVRLFRQQTSGDVTCNALILYIDIIYRRAVHQARSDILG